MDDDDQLVLARLEEQVLDVGEEDVDAVGWVERGGVAEAVLMDLDFAGDALAVHGWADKDVVHHWWTAVWMLLV